MKKLFGWLFNRWTFSVIGIVLLTLLVWFLGPLVAIAGYAPLAEEVPRFFTIIFIFLVWGIWNLVAVARVRRTNTEVIQGLAAQPMEPDVEDPADMGSKEEVDALRERFRDALGILKTAKLGGRRGRRQLYQLPWYVIIGPPGAGKTTALRNSGLRFPLTEKLGDQAIQGIGGTRNCDWWFAEEAVLLDTAGRYTTQDSDRVVDKAAWVGFLDLLNRHRRRRPIDGVLVAFSLTDLAQQDSQERSLHAQAIRRRLQELHETLKVQVPIYVIFTKCDLVAGFVEYFDDLGRDERGQVWGVTFPIETTRQPSAVVEALQPEFEALMGRLDDRLFARLDRERDSSRRGAIQGFGQQMAQLKQPLQEFIKEVFQPSRYENQSLLRGVYFSSGTQEGTPIDRVISSISGAFGLDRLVMPAFSGPGRSYFLTRLLSDVVFQEADLVVSTGRFDRFRSAIQWGSYGTAAAVLALLALVWLTSYGRNEVYIADVESTVGGYEQLAAQFANGQGNELEILPLLGALRALPGGYDDRDSSAPLTMGFGLYQGEKLGDAARAAYRRALSTKFLPRILSRLEGQIQESTGNASLLYEALKVYLMLGNPEFLDRDLVATWVALDWEIRLPGPSNAEAREALGQHLSTLLQGELRAVPLDGTVVAQARAVLLRQPLAQRVYGQIEREAGTSDLNEWRLTDKIGADAARYFRRVSGAPLSQGVPGLYTYNGFRDHFLARGQSLIREAAAQTWVLGAEYEAGMSEAELANLTHAVTELYLANYIRQWEDFLKDIDIAAFSSFDVAVGVVNGLSAVDSPMRAVLRAVRDETKLGRSPVELGGAAEAFGRLQQVKDRLAKLLEVAPKAEAMTGALDPYLVVDRRFEKLHALVGNADQATAPIDQVIGLLKDLYLHLASISTSGSRGDAARAASAGDSGIVQRVRLEADRLPDPVRRWLRSLSQASSQITSGAVRSRLASVWSSEVTTYCTSALSNRYPLSKTSPDDVNLSDFAQYFGPQGKVERFFNEYLSPFVDTSARPWRTIGSGGQSTAISTAALRQFEAAARIRQAFFGAGGASPSVSFEIRPAKLHNAASQVMLELGKQRLTYRHGPPRAARMQWPSLDGENRARLSFTSVAGARIGTLKADGPWALFRLLDQGTIEDVGSSDRFLVTFESEGVTASFELRATSVVNPFRLETVRGYRCLERL